MPFYGSPLIQDFFRVFAQNRAEPMCPPSHKTDRSGFATDRQKFPNSRVSWSLGYVQRSGFHRPLIFSLTLAFRRRVLVGSVLLFVFPNGNETMKAMKPFVPSIPLVVAITMQAGHAYNPTQLQVHDSVALAEDELALLHRKGALTQNGIRHYLVYRSLKRR